MITTYPGLSAEQKMKCRFFQWLVAVTVQILFYVCASGQANTWKQIDKGLLLGTFQPPLNSHSADPGITVVKIDPKYYSFRLICASENNNNRMTAKEWSKAKNLVAAINAGMFQTDGISNVGYMKNFSHLNNSRANSYNAVLAFNPIVSGIPEIQIIDRKCQDFEQLRSKYQTLVQNIRMISCKGENVWVRQDRSWSMAVMGIDKEGQVLFIFSREPYPVHDFIDILFSLPISINNAMYLEGGPEASLYLSASGTEIEKVGGFETGFNEDAENNHAWPIPNVIGIVKRQK